MSKDKNTKISNTAIGRIALTILSSILSILATPPYSFPFLCWVCLAPLCLAIYYSTSLKESAKLGFLYGAIFSLGTLTWMQNISTIGWVAMSWLAIFPCMWAYISKKINRVGIRYPAQPHVFTPILLSTLWVAIDLIKEKIPPFNCSNTSEMTNNLVVLQTASILGTLGISFIISLSNFTLAQQIFFGWRRLQKSSLLFLFITFLLYGIGLIKISQKVDEQNYQTIKVAIISTDFLPTDDLNDHWRKYRELIENTKTAASSSVDIIIWSETIPFTLLNNQHVWDELKNTLISSPSTPLLVTSRYYDDNKLYNAALLLKKENNEIEMQVYKKTVLMPIGEYPPLKFIIDNNDPKQQEISSGKEEKVLTFNSIKGVKIKVGVGICSEELSSSLFNEYKKQGANLLICPANSSTTTMAGALQQERFAVIRAIETKLPMIRVANCGISEIINKNGEAEFKTTLPGLNITKIKIPY